MKRYGPLNSDMSKTLADIGHTDTIAIGDCGLPIPTEVKKIDLAIEQGVPRFMTVLKNVAEHLVIEKVTIATEIITQNPDVYAAIQALFGEAIPIVTVSHEQLKAALPETKAVIRTGEATPYANIILHAGVNF
ncbi:D-ribose pyranase [Brochothrix campestris]|uniref:D-ribose pyranase n=1 Tax=Brochothrix campestris FSL F6-1037 TaxID=1265861 RepID=W7D104_9LIST|nr:D-ribose pyranase [Brochothrix campestris]EUJ41676.1 D-ribose pyranase [Brochothrix campestris FSL F6-1037]